MTIIQAAILGIVQALTEFLPVSSSGHLVLAQKLFLLEKPPIFFDVLVHVGTLIAIIFYLRKDLIDFFRSYKNVVIGTLPIVAVGLLLWQSIDKIFNSYTVVGISLLITAVILWSTIFIKKFEKNLNKINRKDALFIGIFQALAILPGVSRSGSTISAGLWRNLDRKTAFKFSFFLAIPAILGALILQLIEAGSGAEVGVINGLVGMITAIIFGFLALRILEKALIKGKMPLFGIYCFLLGIIVLIFL